MKATPVLFLFLSLMALGGTLAVAGEYAEDDAEKKMVIALMTDDFELDETDVSHLGIGDAETIVTENGQTIDLLRTEDGIDVFVDGELLDLGSHGDDGLHGEHGIVHKRVEVICETEGDCEKHVMVTTDGEVDLESLHGEGHEKVIVIKKKAESD
ncbi:MAG: hypothetical protein HKP03_04830 [Xanthomonadales bacterium]|nr:hypothetical protein [Xanthomonadales bacterium]